MVGLVFGNIALRQWFGPPTLASLVLIGLPGTAISEVDQRAPFVEEYLGSSRQNSGLFQSTPVSHVIPAQNMVAYSLQMNQQQTTVLGKNYNGTPNVDGGKLDVTGYSVAPYLSLSLKKIGLGFSVESGAREMKFSSPQSSYLDSEMKVDYRAVGVYVYWIPVPQLWDQAMPSVLIGGRSYTANHRYARKVYDGESKSTTKDENGNDVTISSPTYKREEASQRYSIPNLEVGLNVDYRVFLNLRIIPWMNYSHMDIGEAEKASENVQEPDHKRFFQMASEVFWTDKPDLRYGIDFGVNIATIQIRIGGLVGMMASMGPSSDYIQDKSLSISFSVEQKGD